MPSAASASTVALAWARGSAVISAILPLAPLSCCPGRKSSRQRGGGTALSGRGGVRSKESDPALSPGMLSTLRHARRRIAQAEAIANPNIRKPTTIAAPKVSIIRVALLRLSASPSCESLDDALGFKKCGVIIGADVPEVVSNVLVEVDVIVVEARVVDANVVVAVLVLVSEEAVRVPVVVPVELVHVLELELVELVSVLVLVPVELVCVPVSVSVELVRVLVLVPVELVNVLVLVLVVVVVVVAVVLVAGSVLQ